jgi:hypothetical protein
MSSGGSTGMKLKEEIRWALGIPGRTNSSVFLKVSVMLNKLGNKSVDLLPYTFLTLEC